MGSLQRLGALKSHPFASKKKGLIYVSVSINGHAICTLLDTEAMHNFIFEDEAKHLGPKVTKEKGTIKAVNSPAKPIVSTA